MKMKKLLAIVLALVVVASLSISLIACGETTAVEDGDGVTIATEVNYAPTYNTGDLTGKSLKVGVIWIGDSTEGYTEAHIVGLNKAIQNVQNAGATVTLTTKEKVGEDATCTDEAKALAAAGNTLIISNSYGHQTFMNDAAKQYPNATFVAMTGDFAGICGTANLKNAFNDTYQSRYVSGVVAGLKLKQLIADNLLTEKNYSGENIKIGYVGAFPYAEVVSGYTAFYLGIKSVVSNVVMDVKYTQSWFNFQKEYDTAKAFIADGCIIIGQHADSEGAPTACEEAYMKGTRVYSVGYNVDMLEAAPHAALTSATNDWSVYYTYALTQALKGEAIATDWAEGYNQGAVAITKINGKVFKEDPSAEVKAVVDAIHNGTKKVFDVNTFTVKGEKISTYKASLSFMDFSGSAPQVVYAWTKDNEVIVNGEFVESDATNFRAAPYFDIRIDGITEK